MRFDVSRLQTLRSLFDIEGDRLTFRQGLEAAALDGGKMHEQVRAASAGEIKPKPLDSLNHFTVPFAICDASCDVVAVMPLPDWWADEKPPVKCRRSPRDRRWNLYSPSLLSNWVWALRGFWPPA